MPQYTLRDTIGTAAGLPTCLAGLIAEYVYDDDWRMCELLGRDTPNTYTFERAGKMYRITFQRRNRYALCAWESGREVWTTKICVTVHYASCTVATACCIIPRKSLLQCVQTCTPSSHLSKWAIARLRDEWVRLGGTRISSKW